MKKINIGPLPYQPEEDSYLLSEVIKNHLPKFLKKHHKLKFLEIGSGSGIQLETALSQGIKKENIFSCDINSTAVRYCRGLGFNCIKSNLFSNIKGQFDLIIFNPPYLPKNSLEPKDSRMATTGGKLGSEVINEFLRQATLHLAKEGKIFLLVSSLTRGIDFEGYEKKIISHKKIFFEELIVWELSLHK